MPPTISGVTPKSLYLIDGHAQIYRAYFAPFRALTSPTGEPTRAVHVFMQMLLGLLRDRRPDYVVMTMDVSDETVFRVEIDKSYKARREPPPEDLPPQADRIVAILRAIGVPILRQSGYEADDIMATLARRFAGDALDVFLVSRDKDLDQLLGDHVRMYDPGKDRVIDVPAMIEEKGYGPDQAIEAQMLMGDSVDNVAGVNGVGPKKAVQLLDRYGSIAAIIDHADELTPKLRENILAFRQRADTVRQLVTLRDDMELDFDLESADVAHFDLAAATPILRELGMNRMIERVASSDAPDAPAESDDAPSASPAAPDLLLGEDQAKGKYTLVDTPDALAKLVADLARVEALAFDTETTGLVPAASDLVGISVSWEADSGYYVPVRGVGRTLPQDDVIAALKPIFENPKIAKCGQNLKYDIVMLKTCGIDVRGVDFDSMIASFVLDSSRRSHGLDALSVELLRYRPIPTHDIIGKGKSQITFDQVPVERVCEYAAEDADVAWRLCQTLRRRMTDPELTALFRDVEMPLVEVLAEMERIGVCVDTDLLGRLSNEMADGIAELRMQIHDAAGRPFNVDSTRQLGEVLFDERKLPVVKRTRTARSTDAAVLDVLAAQTSDPIPRLVLQYRELTKLKSTYVDALPEMVCSRTGRIHPSFHQTGAVTGRLSCSDPNLQNIPIRTPLGARIRRAFVPGADDAVIIKADYSQVELRVLAHFSRDAALSEAFHEDRDIHAFVAAQIAGVPIADVTPEQRANAKTVNFGIVYGQSAFGLARQTGMSVGQAKVFIDQYFQRYPRIRAFLDECVQQAKRHGFVKTILGRRRAIQDIQSRNQGLRHAAERLAINSVVQGSAADLIKKAMIRIDRRIREENRPSKMLIQVHDELVFESPRKSAADEAKMIAGEMASALPLDVPIRVDVAWGPNWLDMENQI
jgi:DNA polymerase-1